MNEGTFRLRPPEVKATRWRNPQDHAQVLGWPGKVEGECRRCSLPMKRHGLLVFGGFVCPGAWIVVYGDGRPAEVMDNRKFKALYERVPEGNR